MQSDKLVVYFTDIRTTHHYIKDHEREIPWGEVVWIVSNTKNPRKKGDKFEIENSDCYILFKVRSKTAYIINAKRQ